MNYVKTELCKQGVEQNITHETFRPFLSRIKPTLEHTSNDYVYNTIESKSKRMMLVIGRQVMY